MKRLVFASLVALVGAGLVTSAQISAPYTFTAGTAIRSAQVNANFAMLADALNRTGGTMTGTLTARDIAMAAHNTYDVATTGTRAKNGWFAGTVTATTGFAGPLTGAVTGNVTGDLTGNVLASDGSVGTPGIRFSSDTDTGFYRIGANNFAAVVAGVMKMSWAASQNVLFNASTGLMRALENGGGTLIDLHIRPASGKKGCLSFTEDTIADRFAMCTAAGDDILTIGTGTAETNTAIATIDTSQKRFTVTGGFVATGVQNVTTADAGTTITLNDDATMVRITEGGTSSGDEILGITGGTQGRSLLICLVDDSVGGVLQIVHESGGVATAANRILGPGSGDVTINDESCIGVVYDGTTSRWRVIRTS